MCVYIHVYISVKFMIKVTAHSHIFTCFVTPNTHAYYILLVKIIIHFQIQISKVLRDIFLNFKT